MNIERYVPPPNGIEAKCLSGLEVEAAFNTVTFLRPALPCRASSVGCNVRSPGQSQARRGKLKPWVRVRALVQPLETMSLLLQDRPPRSHKYVFNPNTKQLLHSVTTTTKFYSSVVSRCCPFLWRSWRRSSCIYLPIRWLVFVGQCAVSGEKCLTVSLCGERDVEEKDIAPVILPK